MDSFPEHNPEQASYTELTIEQIKELNVDKLLEWIQNKRSNVLEDDDLKKLKTARISGRAFLMQAGNVEFFENKCNLPIGPSLELADLAREMAGGKTAGMVQKGKEQDTSTGKSTNHAPLSSLH